MDIETVIISVLTFAVVMLMLICTKVILFNREMQKQVKELDRVNKDMEWIGYRSRYETGAWGRSVN